MPKVKFTKYTTTVHLMFRDVGGKYQSDLRKKNWKASEKIKKKTLMNQTVGNYYLVGYMNASWRQGTVKVKLFIMVGHP